MNSIKNMFQVFPNRLCVLILYSLPRHGEVHLRNRVAPANQHQLTRLRVKGVLGDSHHARCRHNLGRCPRHEAVIGYSDRHGVIVLSS